MINRRRYIRYSAQGQSITWLKFTDEAPQELRSRIFPALVVDESRISLSCSVVFPKFSGEINQVIWIEKDGVETLVRVTRLNHLASQVYLIVFLFEDDCVDPIPSTD